MVYFPQLNDGRYMHTRIPAAGLTADSYNMAMTKRVGRSPPFPLTQLIRDWMNDLYLTVAQVSDSILIVIRFIMWF